MDSETLTFMKIFCFDIHHDSQPTHISLLCLCPNSLQWPPEYHDSHICYLPTGGIVLHDDTVMVVQQYHLQL